MTAISGKNFGFTLVELMLVVVVLGILTAIAVPKFQNFSEEARTQSCRQNLRNIASAIQMYFSAYGEYPGAYEGHTWKTLEDLNEFLENSDALRCPSSGSVYKFRITGRLYQSYRIRGWMRECKVNHGMYIDGIPNWN